MVVFKGPEGPELATLGGALGGLSTPHTPRSVAYYLDQASRSQSVGANSAAVAMYRAALDHVMFEQGYQKGMLGQRISQLTDDIRAGRAPKWSEDLDPEFLGVMKDLGNESIHTNDGDVARQSHLDADLLVRLGELFTLLLFVIYEAPQRRAELKKALKEKLDTIRAGPDDEPVTDESEDENPP